MTSGIYKLTFSDGTTYIGKSVDIERRWKEHADKFAKRTAAKAMQYAYDTCGMPSTSVISVLHCFSRRHLRHAINKHFTRMS